MHVIGYNPELVQSIHTTKTYFSALSLSPPSGHTPRGHICSAEILNIKSINSGVHHQMTHHLVLFAWVDVVDARAQRWGAMLILPSS